MKTIKKFASLFLTLTLLFSLNFISISTVYAQEEQPFARLNEIFSSNEYNESDTAITIYEHFVEHFGEEFMNNRAVAHELHEEIMYLFPVSRDEQIIYPDYFAGFYLGDDGNLVIGIVEDRLMRAGSDMLSGFTNRSEVMTRSFEFSYNELMETASYIRQRTRDYPNVVSLGVRIMKNRVIVDLLVYDDDHIAHFKEHIIDSPKVAFMEVINMPGYLLDIDYSSDEISSENSYQESEITPRAITFSPGGRVWLRDQSGRVGDVSLGYRVRHRNNSNIHGFVTATHGQFQNATVFPADPRANPNISAIGFVDSIAYSDSIAL